MAHRIFVLKNEIKEYFWGSRTFIPELIGMPVPRERPQAEMWLGAHPAAPSLINRDGREESLAALIKIDPKGMLGNIVAEKFSGALPFLFKVLSSARPLSIQAHPNKEQAARGFEQENNKGVPIDSHERNYKDLNHKPELICALTKMWAVKGFRRREEIIELTERIGTPALAPYIDCLRAQEEEEDGLRNFFISLMTANKERQKSVIEEVLVKAGRLWMSGPLIDWMKRLYREYPGDTGVLSPLFLNVICLEPGEAMYIKSGELHGYLEGSGLEIMANSDNVIRGGLTSKHIDVQELVDILAFTPAKSDIICPKPIGNNEALYGTENDEFILSVISLKGGPKESSLYRSSDLRSAEIIICTQGLAQVEDISTGETIELHKGISIFIPASIKGYVIYGSGTFYKAATPLR